MQEKRCRPMLQTFWCISWSYGTCYHNSSYVAYLHMHSALLQAARCRRVLVRTYSSLRTYSVLSIILYTPALLLLAVWCKLTPSLFNSSPPTNRRRGSVITTRLERSLEMDSAEGCSLIPSVVGCWDNKQTQPLLLPSISRKGLVWETNNHCNLFRDIV